MIFISSAAVRSHLAHGVVRFDVARKLALWIATGTVIGAVLATRMDSEWVKIGFATFCIYSAVRMLFFAAPVLPPVSGGVQAKKSSVPGMFFGLICGMIGVGGANLLVPYMLRRGVQMREAMATASALQIPIAVVGTAIYVLLGIGLLPTTPAALGYVHIPALILVAVSSVVAAPWGVKLSHRLPVAVLKRMFGVVTALVGLKMAGAFSFLAATFATAGAWLGWTM